MISKPVLRPLFAAVLSLSGLVVTAQSPAPVKAPTARVAAAYSQLPLTFEPNLGQADSAVQYLARGGNYTVLLQPSTATLLLNSEHSKADTRRAAVRMTLDGVSAAAALSPERPLPGYVNYLTGGKNRSHTGIPTYSATRVTAAYPGIDLVYYGTDRQLEYDFIVAPHSDPSLIHLAIDGAQPVLEPSGELRLQFAAAKQPTDIVVRKPTLYQQLGGKRQPVDGSFTLAANGQIGFRIGTYDHSRQLVIDPVIAYGSYFGGNVQDEINGSALNAANQLYAVGQTLSPTLPSGAGEFQPARSPSKNNNYHDAFVTKFSADGSTVLWTTYLSGSQDDTASAVAVNPADQAYVVGNTNSCGADNSIPGVAPNTSVRFPFTGDEIQTLCSPTVIGSNNFESNGGQSYDAFLVKLSSDGKTELYGTPLGGSQNDFASSIVLDATGRPYIVGETNSTGYYKCATVGPHCADVPAYPVDNHGNADIGVGNYPTTANAAFSNIAESIQYATTDSNGNTGGPQDEQAFLTVLSADLHSFVYSSLIGGGIIGGCGNGTCNTNGIAIAVNAAGQAFIGGNTSSAHWPTTTGAFATTCSNAGAANSQCPMTGWLAGFDPSQSGTASLLFSTYINGSSAGKDSNGNPLFPAGDVYGLAVDSKGNVVATGDTNADNFPTTAGTLQPACVQFGDGNGNSLRCQSAFITKLSPTGATVWSTYFGPTTQPGNFVIGNGLALDASDNVFVVGTSTSPTLPLVNPISTNPAQNDDAFVIELSPTGAAELMGTFLRANGNLTVNNNSLHLDSSLNAYISGYQGFCTNCTITFPTTPGAPATGSTGGSSDGWVLKLITQQQTPTVTLQINPTATTPGTPITFTATVAGLTGFATPTGTVTLTSGSTTLGTITLANGSGTFTSSTLAVGTYNVVATYSGDVVYAATTPTTGATSPQTLAIQNTPTVALTATPTTAAIGTAIALQATVSFTTGTPTGTVYFMDSFSTLGSSVLASGVATYSATGLAVGSHSITAHYGGDANFAAYTSTAQTVTITAVSPSITAVFNPASITIAQGSTGTSTLTITPANGFAGTLSFSCGAAPSSASCGFSAATLQFTATSSAAQSTTLTISTNASIVGALRPEPVHGNSLPLLSLASLLLLPLAFTRRGSSATRSRSLFLLALPLLVLVSLSALSGCNGSGSSSTPSATTTPVGVYSFTVNVAGAPSPTTPALQVTVQ